MDNLMFGRLTCEPASYFQWQQYALPVPLAGAAQTVGLAWTHMWARPVQWHALAFALFASLVAPFGGFFASGIKRAYGIKDFESLLPGHGGVTDRMDCQLITGLFSYVYSTTFVFPSVPSVEQLLHRISMLSADEQRRILLALQQRLVT